MRKSDLREGLLYLVRPAGGRLRAVTVRLDRIREFTNWRGQDVVQYQVTNVNAGTRSVLRSAQQFLEEVRAETTWGGVRFRELMDDLPPPCPHTGEPLADLLRRSLEDLLGTMDTAELLRIRCESANVQLQEYCHKELHRRGAAKEPYGH